MHSHALEPSLRYWLDFIVCLGRLFNTASFCRRPGMPHACHNLFADCVVASKLFKKCTKKKMVSMHCHANSSLRELSVINASSYTRVSHSLGIFRLPTTSLRHVTQFPVAPVQASPIMYVSAATARAVSPAPCHCSMRTFLLAVQTCDRHRSPAAGCAGCTAGCTRRRAAPSAHGRRQLENRFTI